MNQSKKIGIVFSVVILVGVFAVLATENRKSDTTAPQQIYTDVEPQNTPSENNPSGNTTEPTPLPPSTKPTTPTKTSVYKNGTYSATGSYMSPGGLDHVNVTLTLSNDVVTDATVTEGAGDRTSARYQSMFISGYKQYVVGKNIGTLTLTKVSGSSLTPIGFNDAVAQIKAEAKA